MTAGYAGNRVIYFRKPVVDIIDRQPGRNTEVESRVGAGSSLADKFPAADRAGIDR